MYKTRIVIETLPGYGWYCAAVGGRKPKNCNIPKNCNKPSMSELKNAQKQLNQEMKKAKNDPKNKGQAKSLMKLAKKQEEIRRNLMELMNEEGIKDLNETIKNMEENEIDIVNNNITLETIKRQQEILSKMLESEDALREKDEATQRASIEWDFTIDQETENYLEFKRSK